MEKVKLKDICRLINGRAYKQEELLDSGKYPVLRVGNFFSDKVFYYSDLELEEDKYCDNGDLLFAWSASFGPKIWDGEKVIYHYHIWKMELTDRVNKEFLFYYLFHLSERIKSEGHGGIMIHTTKAEMEEREFNLPTLEEQIAISEILNKVMSVIDKRKEELSVLDDLIKARFVEMFGSIHESTKYPYIAVKDLTDITSGGTPSRDKTEYWDNGTIPWVKTTELQNNVLIDVDEHITEAGLAGSSAKLVPVGTILVAMYGQGKTRGMTAYLGVEASTNQACACILPSDKVDSMFMWKYFELSYDKLRSLAQGAGQPNLNGNMIKNFQVLVPPIELQKEYVDFVHQINKSKVVDIDKKDKL